MSFNQHKVEHGMALILEGLGVDKNDANFTHTPERYARALREMFYPEATDWATFAESYNDFILLRGHQVFSLCPHHALPVALRVSLAYVPNGHVLGLSKLARLLDEANDKPLLQEKFTMDALTKLQSVCPDVRGAACAVSGRHSCLSMRGVKSQADFFTYSTFGRFDEDSALVDRFLRLVGEQRV
jgi:GTP cyclohydrolase I